MADEADSPELPRHCIRLWPIILTIFACGFACRGALYLDDEGVAWYAPAAYVQFHLYGIGLFLLFVWIVSCNSVRGRIYGSLLGVAAAFVSFVLLLSSIPK